MILKPALINERGFLIDSEPEIDSKNQPIGRR